MREDITPEEMLAAERRWDEEVGCYPPATAARYEPAWRRVIVTLSTGLEIILDPRRTMRLDNVSDAELLEIEVSGTGYELSFQY